MSDKPKVSIVVPVYNTEKYLEECLNSFLAQTMEDYEIICVDDGSSDRSPEILKEYAKKDKRIHILNQQNGGAGAARNYGFRHARGEYTIFFDSDDYCDPDLLKKAVEKADALEAEITAFEFYRVFPDGKKELRMGVHRNWLPEGTEIFNYKDCPDRIMNVVNPTPWNKLYRTDFIRKHNLRFEEIPSTNDVTFAAVSVAAAQRIAVLEDALVYYRVGIGGTITSGKQKTINDVVTAVTSALRQVRELPYYDEISAAAIYFSMEIYITSLYRYIVDFKQPAAKKYYETLHEYFNTDPFDGLKRDEVGNDILYNRVMIVRQWSYNDYCELRSRRLIVSLTSYPARIGGVHHVLETIYNQSHQADEVVLWLSEEQFHEKEKKLPEELNNLVHEGKLTIKWCEDLKPHKKYFYAFREYSDDIIVTIDDDMLYAANLLEHLYDSYLMYPHAVSAARVHLMAIAEDGEILPYRWWIRETDGCIYEPSMQLFATGAGGVLYPPHLLDMKLLDEQAIRETCLYADDIWLKAMELLNDVPVVLTEKFRYLKYVPGSQEEALCHQNADQGLNDMQFKKVINWIDTHYKKGILADKLLNSVSGKRLIGTRAITEFVAIANERSRGQYRQVYQKLQQTYAEKSEINRKLQQTYAEKSEINRKLQQTYKEKAERGIRIKELEKQLRDEKQKRVPLTTRGYNKLKRTVKKVLKK